MIHLGIIVPYGRKRQMAYGLLDFATEVLKTAAAPLTAEQIWEAGEAKGLRKKLKTVGKTPWETIAAKLYVNIRDDPNSMFIKVSKHPTRFFWKERAKEIRDDLFPEIRQRR